MIEVKDGVLRFKANRIVQDILDLHLDINQIEGLYRQGRYIQEEKYQFLALIGYSMEGWSEILYQYKILFNEDKK